MPSFIRLEMRSFVTQRDTGQIRKEKKIERKKRKKKKKKEH